VSILEHYGVLASKIEKNTCSDEELISTEKIASTKEGLRVTDSKENHLNTSIQRLNTRGRSRR
jgi:hypothetical protein